MRAGVPFPSAAVVFFITLVMFGRSDSQQVSYDPDIECDLAELIWEYAKKLIPSRGAFLSVYDAVNLEKCNISKYSGNSDKGSRRYVQVPLGTVSYHYTWGKKTDTRKV